MRIAVIGSGISGMGAAYLLSREHEVTLYEKASRIGGHTRTVVVDYDGLSIPVDTGFIVFNKPNYPHLTGLFDHLGVAYEKSDMSFGISVDGGKREWSAQTMATIFGQPSNLLRPRFWRMLADVKRFFAHAETALEKPDSYTLGNLLDDLQLGEAFREDFLLPMAGAIWSCPTATMLDYPAATFVRFFKNHGLLTVSDQPQWHTVTGGSQEYIRLLTRPYADNIHTDAEVVGVTRDAYSARVRVASGAEERYDHVVFASHADETLALLDDASDEERRILGAFKYQPNHMYLHADARFMPKRRRCWASWIYLRDSRKEENAIAVSYWMNQLQNIDHDYPLFVTLNPAERPERVFDEHVFAHPVFTPEAIAAQHAIPALQGERNTWFCGAYQRYGFHEDGLWSAVRVAEQFGVKIPW